MRRQGVVFQAPFVASLCSRGEGRPPCAGDRAFASMHRKIKEQTNSGTKAIVCQAGEISTGRCNTGFKFLCWGLVLQGLSDDAKSDQCSL